MNQIYHEYQKVLGKLFLKSRGLGSDFKLERMEKALFKLCNPHTRYPTIHIAGTNGKGSVSTKTAYALQLQGFKVGLYTSPHIRSLCERIQINRAPISYEKFLKAYQFVTEQVPVEEMGLTFFEIVTLIAFFLFHEEKVDIAVIEVGLGGRLDATNLIHPLVSVITSIGFDHVAQLGGTLEAITREKAGIIKHNTPTVIGPSVPFEIVNTICQEKNSALHQVTFKSDYDQENSMVAAKVLSLMPKPFQLTDEIIQKAIQVRPSCRFEEVPGVFPSIILDVAHNPQGIERLLEMLEKRFPGLPYVAVFAASKEKEISQMLSMLVQKSALCIYTTNPEAPRLLSSEELYEKAVLLGIPKEKIAMAPTVESALMTYAIPYAQKYSIPIIVTGSFFIMGKVRQILGYTEFDDPIFSNEAFIKLIN